MKKRITLVLVLILILISTTGCMTLGVTTLSSLFSNETNSLGVTIEEKNDEESTDTVTISRAEYERYKEFDQLIYMMDVVEEYGYYEADHQKLLQSAFAGSLNGVDDVYTFYYTPEEFAEMWEDDAGEYAGVGLQITANYQTNICTISRVFENSPALEAGVLKGDILYRVGDDLYVTAQNLQDAVDIMRGTPGTTVPVTFIRNGEEITFELLRANITVNYVEHTMLEDDIGLIRLFEFSGECAKDFVSRFEDLKKQGAKSLIIDLRDNPGGWVDAATTIADLFCDKGDVCYLEYKDGSQDHTYRTTDGKTEMPIVIILNENSASASEILSGCLRDRANATLVGVQSFGKGIVQQVLYVSEDGAGMQFTIAEYLTPNGVRIHKIGLTPDVISELPEGDTGMYNLADPEDPQLRTAIEVMKEKMN